MSAPGPLSFTLEWQVARNSHDPDGVPTCYADSIRLCLRKAQTLVERKLIEGKNALHEHRGEVQPAPASAVRDVFGRDQMTVTPCHNHRDVLAAETLDFNAAALVCRAAARHRDI